MSLTALSPIPKEVKVETNFKAESNNPFKPIPAVPNKTATVLPRISVIKMLNT